MASPFRRSSNDPQETKPRITGDNLRELLQLLRYIRPYRGLFALGLICLLLSSLVNLAFPYMTGKLVDASQGQAEGIFVNLNQTALLLLGVLAAQAVFSFFRILFFVTVSEKALADLRQDLYGHLLHLPVGFFANQRVGELTSRLSSDISLIQDTFTTTLAEFLRGLSHLIIGVVIILFISAELTLVMVASFPVLMLAAVFFGRFIRKLAKQAQDRLAEASIVAEETFSGIQSVKAFARESYERARYRHALSQVVAAALKGARFRGAFASFIIFALFGAIVGVLWYGAGLVQTGEISIGQLTSFLIFTLFIGAAFGGFGEQYAQLQRSLGATQRIRELLRMAPEAAPPVLPIGASLAEAQRPVNHRLLGALSFEHVSFHYPGSEDTPVLRNVSFLLLPGEKVALVGASGAGKSTIMNLVLGFYAPTAGQLHFDGTPVDQISLHDRRSQLAWVPQDVFLFGGTIRDNIAYGMLGASQAEIETAARRANAHSFIMQFPAGYDTVVGERGVKLSGGQRQRIAIARAILADPVILLLDEATSSLDSESEHLVQQALDELMRGRTTLVIAHRLATVRNADRILVLEQGQIVESGTHQELSHQGGLYQHLADLQFA